MEKLSKSKAIASVIKYELKWDLRKKKIYISLGIVAALSLLVTIYLGHIVKISDKQDYWMTSLSILSSYIFLFLMGAPVTMNTISGEFESGTIIPLLSRPVSRTDVYIGKVIASFIIILAEMLLLGVILSVVSTIIMGPQNDLYQLGIFVLTLTVSTMVYAAFTMMLSSITRNSTASILTSFGVMFAIEIALGIYEMEYSFQDWFITLPFIGSNNLTTYAIEAFKNPNGKFSLIFGIVKGTFSNINTVEGTLITFLFALIYILIFFAIGWIVFKKIDIKD